MVVHIDSKNSDLKIKKFIGDNQQLNFKCNSSSIVVIGNECKITIEQNQGNLKVIGERCHVTVQNGTGTITYTGNDGKLNLGGNIDREKVIYIGKRGTITDQFTSEEITNCTPSKKKNKSSIKKDANQNLNISGKTKVHLSVSENIHFNFPNVITLPPNIPKRIIKIHKKN
jgi:hypothetical protein